MPFYSYIKKVAIPKEVATLFITLFIQVYKLSDRLAMMLGDVVM